MCLRGRDSRVRGGRVGQKGGSEGGSVKDMMEIIYTELLLAYHSNPGATIRSCTICPLAIPVTSCYLCWGSRDLAGGADEAYSHPRPAPKVRFGSDIDRAGEEGGVALEKVCWKQKAAWEAEVEGLMRGSGPFVLAEYMTLRVDLNCGDDVYTYYNIIAMPRSDVVGWYSRT
jgi:hypothetical protein